MKLVKAEIEKHTPPLMPMQRPLRQRSALREEPV